MLKEIIAKPRILLSERNKDWTAVGALCELIDNSLGADRGNAEQVEIKWDKRKRILTIHDNGRGMEQVSYLFGLGDGTAGTNKDIGRYGQGGSAALLWLADQVKVWTVRDGERAYTAQDFRTMLDGEQCRWPMVDDRWVRATPGNVPAPLNGYSSGTMIQIKMRDRLRFYPAPVQKELSKLYAAGMRAGRNIIWTDVQAETSEQLQPWNPVDVIWEKPFTVEVNGMTANVMVCVGDSIKQTDAGMSVTFGHRQIKKTRDPLGTYDGGKVYGWIDLGPEWHPYLSNNKTTITDAELWDALMKKVNDGLADVLALLDQQAKNDFVAKLNLEINNLNLGALVKPQSQPKDDEDLDDDDEDDNAEDDDKPKPLRPKKPKKPEGGIQIDVKESTDLDGRVIFSTIHPGIGVTVLVDPDSEVIQQARESKPINMQWMRWLVAESLATAMITGEMVVTSGLFTQEEWDVLRDGINHNELMTSSYVTPKVFDVITSIPTTGEEKAA
jgi:hypothetical protein